MALLNFFDPKRIHQILTPGSAVKTPNKKMERPGIFIGCSRESLSIAQFVKEQFEPDLYEVDIWDEGIFGSTNTTGEGHQNIHWLKNFTDIYDFAIFLFVPDDIILSQTREEDGEFLKEAGIRHNVVFEFGLFLGRIGSKKTFILFDNGAENFVKQFFTDLSDSAYEFNENFIRFFKYSGRYLDWIRSRVGIPYNAETLRPEVLKIKAAINTTASDIDLSFLPSTSLAIGYFNNFIKIVSDFFCNSKSSSPSMHQNIDLEATVNLIRKKQRLKIAVVIPDNLSDANHENCKKYFNDLHFTPISFPGQFRPMTSHCMTSSIPDSSDAIVLCDLPTTLSSSSQAITMITDHKDIRELLNEKEKRNFKKVLEHLLFINNIKSQGTCSVLFISWKEFLEHYVT